MTTASLLFFALILDALLGEPKWLWSRVPHPAVLIGQAIAALDKRLNKGPSKRLMGVALVLVLVSAALIVGAIIQGLGWVPTIISCAILLAQRSLVDHVTEVADALRVSLGDGKRAVAKIVGRDTAPLDQSGVSRSAIESAAENLSDGIIAPAFWFLIAGVPGILIYKAVNTADSMIGYRSETYRDFGWAAARLDDVLNWVPARLTALLFALTHGMLHRWSEIRSDALLHRSPNAGWPEAAMARCLGIAVSGPRVYDGALEDYPYVNDFGRKDLNANDIDAAVAALWRAWALLLGIIFILALL